MKKSMLYLITGYFVLFLLLIGTYCYSDMREKNSYQKSRVIPNFVNLNIHDVEEYADFNGIVLDVEYQYSDDIEVNKVISQSLIAGRRISFGEKCMLVVSNGKIPVKVYQEYHVNELGDVPIMMYHGIVNMQDEETEYIGGNVDKDGYNRTVESFRDDLEFYYQSGYRMIRLIDYVSGNIEVELGMSPIVLTFDDGSENNFRVLGEENGELLIDPNCAIGVLEEFKKKYPDYGVTATFFINGGLFQQEVYNKKILKWLISHGYDIGNHTMSHVDFTEIDVEETEREVGGMYQILDGVISSSFVPIVALPFGSPYQQNHSNYEYILSGDYLGKNYETKAALRVGWEAEVSCFDINFQPYFLKRIRAYDNNGRDFDIEYNFKLLENNRYISDGDINTIVIKKEDSDILNNMDKKVIVY